MLLAKPSNYLTARFRLKPSRKCSTSPNQFRCVSGTYTINLTAKHTTYPSLAPATHTAEIDVQNDCAQSSVNLSPSPPTDGWLKFNGQNYTPGMVVPFVADWAYDVSKLILNESKCQSMSIDQKLLLFADSATYGSSTVSIFSATKNPSAQEFVEP